MITLVSPEIEEYSVRHTSPLPSHMQELMEFTTVNMEMSMMLSGPIEGSLLQFLAFSLRAKRVLDVGTFTGFSAQMMAAALPEDGEVVTCEFDAEHARIAREFADKGPNGHKIDIRIGPALATLATLEPAFDLVFVDAEKTEYEAYYERALELLSPHGMIAVDNVLWGGRVLDPQSDSDRAIAAFNAHVLRDPRTVQVLLPVRDGVLLIHRA